MTFTLEFTHCMSFGTLNSFSKTFLFLNLAVNYIDESGIAGFFSRMSGSGVTWGCSCQQMLLAFQAVIYKSSFCNDATTAMAIRKRQLERRA